VPATVTFEDRITAWEEEFLSPQATRSYPARRQVEEPDSPLRTPFQRDRDRIVHSKSFRRLKHKTQVFVAPEGDHYRTRLTHTLEACGIARTVARALRLNEDLTEAIGVGHDLGHPPFGHAGEETLDAALRDHGADGFRHNEHSLRMVDVLERGGAGLNLTAEVRDGIRNHTGTGMPASLEGRIVRLVDRFGYVNHDIDDAARADILDPADLPGNPVALLGRRSSERIDALVHDLVETSATAGDIRQSPPYEEALLALRSFMFERVYLGPAARAESARAGAMVEQLFAHHLAGGDAQSATDWVAGMTYGYALRAHAELATAERSPA
jgi:dGTPase